MLWRGKYIDSQQNVESTNSFAFLTLWGWVPSRMNRIPALNLSNRSHTSQDTCLIFKGAAVMQSWICEAGSRTDLIRHLGTDLEWALVPFSFSFFSLHRPTLWSWARSRDKDQKRGAGDGRVPWTKALMTCTKMYGQPICLLRFHSLQPTFLKGAFIWVALKLNLNQYCQINLEPAIKNVLIPYNYD